MIGRRLRRSAEVSELMIAALTSLFLVQQVLLVFEIDTRVGPLLAIGLVVNGIVVFAIMCVHVVRSLRSVRDRIWPLTLLTQAALQFAPLHAFTEPTLATLGFFLASCLILLPRLAALAAVAAAELAATIAILTLTERGVVEAGYVVSVSLFAALAVWGLNRLSDTAAQLRESREQVAKFAVTQERDRLSRDLQDVLGTRLATISERSITAAQLVGTDPAGAADLITSVVDLSRATLFDVRALARGDRGMSVTTQTAAARSILTAAGIELDSELPSAALPAAVDALLAEAIREGVTASLHDARVSRCTIAISIDRHGARLELTDDGPGPPVPIDDVPGGLPQRLHQAGGTLTVSARETGGRALVVTVPFADLAPDNGSRVYRATAGLS